MHLSIWPITRFWFSVVTDRPGNKEIQLALFYDYGSNPSRYPSWQEYFRTYQPPTLIVWGKKDVIFPADGAYPYKKDLKDIEFHLLDTGHFALEEESNFIARCITKFFGKRLMKKPLEKELSCN